MREARPRAFVFENVKGLTRAAFADLRLYPAAAGVSFARRQDEGAMGRPPCPLAQVAEQAGRRQRVPSHVQAGERGQLRRAAKAHARVFVGVRAAGHAVRAVDGNA